MLHRINLPNCQQHLLWIVELQSCIIHALCDHGCDSGQVTEQWVFNQVSALGVNQEWLQKFYNWSHKKQKAIDRMKVIADFDNPIKDLILDAFNHDLQFERAFDPMTRVRHNPIGLTNLNGLNVDIRDAVHRFFESFYDPALYRAYKIPQGGQQLDFDRKMFILEYYDVNKDVQVCPMCDGDLGTPKVDHFFPKSKYSYLSCHPKNLVPVCEACNGPAGKFETPPLTLDAHDQTIDWFHPYLLSADGNFSVNFVRQTEGTTPVLSNPDAQTQTRLDNLTSLVKLQPRWRRALSRKFRGAQRKIRHEREKRGRMLNEQDLCTKLQEWAENQEVEIGLEPFAIVGNAYFQSAANRDKITFDDLWVYNDPNADVVSGN